MRTWKIALIVGLAILAVGLVAMSAYAAVVQPAINPYGAYNGVSGSYGGYAGGMMRGGMMGSYGYSYGSGGCGCRGYWGWP